MTHRSAFMLGVFEGPISMWLPGWVMRRKILAGSLAVAITVTVIIPAALAGAWSFWNIEVPLSQALSAVFGWSRMTALVYATVALLLGVGCVALLFVLIGISLRVKSEGGDIGTGVKEGLDLHLTVEVTDESLVSLRVMNMGPTRSFAAQSRYITAGNGITPFMLRWRGSQVESREIIKGQTQILEVLRASYQPARNQLRNRHEVEAIRILTPSGEESLDLVAPLSTFQDVMVSFQISTSSGESQQYTLQVFVFVGGQSEPVARAVLAA